jgi:uncharacterized protein DUF4242
MTEYLMERYQTRTDPKGVRDAAIRALHAVEELRREHVPIRLLRSLYVPDEETCFYLYEAEAVEQVQEAARRAALPFERIVEAISDPRIEPCP